MLFAQWMKWPNQRGKRCRSWSSLIPEGLAPLSFLSVPVFIHPGATGHSSRVRMTAVYMDCETAGTLRPIVPFGAISGPITVSVGREVALSSTFRVTELCDTSSIVVKPVRYEQRS